jgi:hypothetical protein
MTGEHSRAIRYLLGTLPEQEADALASEMFTDDETFGALEDAEQALIEAYLDDALSADDRRRFEELFQASSHLHERLELERSLRALRSARPSRPRAVAWFPWAAAVVFGLAGGGLALQANRDAARVRTDAASRERDLTARLAEQDERLRTLEQRLVDRLAPAIETWDLVASSQRAGGSAAPFTVTSGWVRLRLSQDDVPAGASYRARISLPEGGEVHAVAGLTAVSESGRAFVDVMVPGGLLPHGTYMVFLTRVGATRSQELGPYSFSVRPR